MPEAERHPLLPSGRDLYIPSTFPEPPSSLLGRAGGGGRRGMACLLPSGTEQAGPGGGCPPRQAGAVACHQCHGWAAPRQEGTTAEEAGSPRLAPSFCLPNCAVATETYAHTGKSSAPKHQSAVPDFQAGRGMPAACYSMGGGHSGRHGGRACLWWRAGRNWCQ